MEPHVFYDCCFPHHQAFSEQIVSFVQRDRVCGERRLEKGWKWCRPLTDMCVQFGASTHPAGTWREQLTRYLAPHYAWVDLPVMITLRWAQGCNLKSQSTVSSHNGNRKIVLSNSKLTCQSDAGNIAAAGGGGADERAGSKTGCRCCVAVFGDWLQIISIIFSPLRSIRLHVNSTRGNGRLLPPSQFHYVSL